MGTIIFSVIVTLRYRVRNFFLHFTYCFLEDDREEMTDYLFLQINITMLYFSNKRDIFRHCVIFILSNIKSNVSGILNFY